MRSPLLLSLAALLFAGGQVTPASAQPASAAPGIAPCTVSVTVPPPVMPAGAGPAALPPEFRGPATEPPRLVKITDDVHVMQNVNSTLPELVAFGGNATIFTTTDGAILVDSKIESQHADLVAKVKTLTDKPIKYVVLTHNHGDHSGGAAKLQQTGATVVMSADDRAHLARDGQAGFVGVTYVGKGNLYLGGKEVQLIQYCGHTRGDTVAFFPAARVVAVGDLVAWPDTIPAIVNYGDGGNWTDTLLTLDAIAALDWQTLVPGHGPTMTKQDFANYRAKFKAIVARTREMVKAGRSQQEISAALGKEFNWGAGPSSFNLPGLMIEVR